jgi:NADH dehydrogenase/NADH:ubiquinone oxidoreductase subunit G
LNWVKSDFSGASVFHYGTPGVSSVAQDAAADKILKRKSKTANLNGLEKLGVSGFDGKVTEAVLVFRGGRAMLPDLSAAAHVVGVGVFMKSQTARFAAVIPGEAFAEKEGTVYNFENREQKFKKAVQAPAGCQSIHHWISAWKGQA